MSTIQEKIEAQKKASEHSGISMPWTRHLIGPEELKQLYEWKYLAKEMEAAILKLKEDLFRKDNNRSIFQFTKKEKVCPKCGKGGYNHSQCGDFP